MATLLAAVGTPTGDQFTAVFQAVLLAPVQVLVCEKAVPDTISTKTIAKVVKNVFIILSIRLENFEIVVSKNRFFKAYERIDDGTFRAFAAPFSKIGHIGFLTLGFQNRLPVFYHYTAVNPEHAGAPQGIKPKAGILDFSRNN